MTLLLPLVYSAAMAAVLAGRNADTHPDVYVDEGACPFECCTYGIWRVDKPTELYSEPNHESRAIRHLAAGSLIDADGGKVITQARRFAVKRDHAEYRRGDVLWVYTYLGEGFFRVWHAGQMEEEQLEFSPEGGTAGDRCQDSERLCWGELDRPLRTTWWIRIRDHDGRDGWTDAPENFSGNDACS